MSLPENISDYVLSITPGYKGTKRTYVKVDGELLNICHEQGHGTDFVRILLMRALKEEFGEALYIHIVKASTGRHIPEPKRTRRQILKEMSAAKDLGVSWKPTGPMDEMSNPVVVIGGADG
jgi:hypothetical protein